MKKNALTRCAIIAAGAVALLARAAQADDISNLRAAVTTIQSDLHTLESVVLAPPANPTDLVTCGADLSRLGSYLKSMALDLTNSPQLTVDINALSDAVTPFDAEVTNLVLGPKADDADLITVGRNFKDTLANIKTIITQDLKQGNTLTNDPTMLGSHLRALARNFEALGPSLHVAGTQKIPSLALHGTNNSWGSIFLWTGARLENPYSITTSNSSGTLKSGNKTTDGFVNFDIDLRYIFRSGRYEDEPWWDDAGRHKATEVKYYWPTQLVPDIDFSLGYVFTGSSAPSNYSTSTIAGGGDLSLDTSVGFPIIRYKPTDYIDTNTLKLQITLPEIGGGIATDKSFLVAHPNLFLGTGFQLAAPAKNFYWVGRLGCGFVDVPRIKSGSTVVLDGLNNPVFDWKSSVTAGSGLIYKVTDALAFQLGGNVYLTHISSWNISAAIAIDPSKFFQSLK